MAEFRANVALYLRVPSGEAARQDLQLILDDLKSQGLISDYVLKDVEKAG